MVFTGLVLYLTFTSSKMETIFFDNFCVLDYITIYFDNFFEVTYDIDQSMCLGFMPLCILKMSHMPKTVEKL